MPNHYSFRDFINTRGRWNRKKFILPNIALNIFSLIYLGLGIAFIKQLPASNHVLYQLFVLCLYLVLIMTILIPAFCITAKRLHDLERSAVWAPLFILLPQILSALPGNSAGFLSTPQLVALLLSSYLYFVKGTPGPNQYGPDPLAADVSPASGDKGDVQ